MKYEVLNYFVEAEREYKRGETFTLEDVAMWPDRDKRLEALEGSGHIEKEGAQPHLAI